MEHRKKLELQYYHDIYEQRGRFDDSTLRSCVMSESEATYAELVEQWSAGNSVLELGCGNINSSIEESAYIMLVRTDFSMEALVQLKQSLNDEQLKRSFLICCDVEKLPFKSGTFGLVCEHEVLSSVEQGAVIKEVLRVLAPRGTFIGMETYGHNPLMNLKRTFNFFRGNRTLWSVRNVMRKTAIERIQSAFSKSRIQHFHVVTLFLYLIPSYLRPRWIFETVKALDRVLCKTPLLQHLAFKVVFVFQNPTGASRGA